MSMPQFTSTSGLTREEAINQILSSIAMEELALSHILNAEGEKLQYILGTLNGSTPPEQPTFDQILQFNDSVQKVLKTAVEKQTVLKDKMNYALEASTMVGPTGPQGPPGVNGDGAIVTFRSGLVYLSSPEVVPAEVGDYGYATIAAYNGSDGIDGVFPLDTLVYSSLPVVYQEQIFTSNIILPRDGVITDFIAQVVMQTDMSSQTQADLTLSAFIYISSDGGATYEPVTTSPIDFSPAITAEVTEFTMLDASASSLNIAVSKGDRLLCVLGVRLNSATGDATAILNNGNFSVAIS